MLHAIHYLRLVICLGYLLLEACHPYRMSTVVLLKLILQAHYAAFKFLNLNGIYFQG